MGRWGGGEGRRERMGLRLLMKLLFEMYCRGGWKLVWRDGLDRVGF